ncbi:Coiled-coil domain-containing protein [Smittium culicis]|uniref:Coiled-coil domain-containing protein n=1 Tax=Smittium culicis TaxID=133412 RepID=A0A1R1Y7A3_9FUNG|nr:Coiled-coil domain-containing protein [Smittium culicis]OMJ22841.1 Coiled-coil domain-containing protein [Smittium culicis]
MQVELERQKWEEEAKSQITNSSSHYNNISDTRNRGAGFYKFSQDESVRKQQQEDLDKLRAETVMKRKHALTDISSRRTKLLADRKSKLVEYLRDNNPRLNPLNFSFLVSSDDTCGDGRCADPADAGGRTSTSNAVPGDTAGGASSTHGLYEICTKPSLDSKISEFLDTAFKLSRK